MLFSKDDLVITPDGVGRVAYVRMAPEEYRHIEAISVILESRSNDPNYSGTLYPEYNVRKIQTVKVQE